jgi:hypothetical protein
MRALVRRSALGYVIVWVLSPVLAYGVTWRVLAFAAMGLWLLLELSANRSVLLRPSVPVMVTLFYGIYSFGVETLGSNSPQLLRLVQIWILLFFLLVGESFRRGREDDARFAFWLILIVLPVWCFTTLRAIGVHGMHAARVVVRSSADAREMLAQGVGGYGLTYVMVLSLPVLFWLALHGRRLVAGYGPIAGWLAYGLFALNFGIGAILIFKAGYSIAMILSGLALLIGLLVRSRQGTKFVLSVLLASLFFVGISQLIKPLLSSTQAFAVGTEYSNKVRDMRSSLDSGESVGTVEGRSDRYFRSLEEFASHPLLGVMDFADVGKHSSILDNFAQFGLIVGGMFLYLLLYLPSQLLRNRRIPIGMALGLFVVACGFPLLNVVFMGWGVVLYVFVPGALLVMGEPLWRANAIKAAPYGPVEMGAG